MLKNKKLFCGILLAIFFLISIPFITRADGGITISVKAPQEEKDINIPSQEAIISWAGGYETIFLSTGIKTQNLVDLAWIIPIPSATKPEVKKADLEIFQQVPYLFSEIEMKSGGEGWIVFLFFGFITLFFFFLSWKRRKKVNLAIVLILVVILILGILSSISLGGGGEIGVSPMEIIETKKVGVYDLTILKATDANYMVNWLNKNGYKISNENIPILQDYCDQKDFYFIVNKINKEALNKKSLLEGMATPLKIKFQPQQPFYPLKLSSINGGETIIDVYFFSNTPIRDESGILSVKKSRNVEKTRDIIFEHGSRKIKKAVDKFYQEYLGKDFFAGNIVTWLHYKGNLEDLGQDAHFKFNQAVCADMSEKEGWGEININMDSCYSILVRTIHDPSLCIQIPNSLFQDICFENVAKKSRSLSLCIKEMEILPSKIGEDKCFHIFAEKNKDSSLCERITDQQEQSLCYKNVAVKTKDFSLCDRTSGNDRGACYYRGALDTKNSSLCDLMDYSTRGRDNCYRKIAFDLKDFSLCEKVVENGLRDSCYYGIIKLTQNYSLCEKIVEPLLKESCYKKRF